MSILVEIIVWSSRPHLENPSCLTVLIHFDLEFSPWNTASFTKSNILADVWVELFSAYFLLFPVEFTYCKSQTKWGRSEHRDWTSHLQERERCPLREARVEFLCRNYAVSRENPSPTFLPSQGGLHPALLASLHGAICWSVVCNAAPALYEYADDAKQSQFDFFHVATWDPTVVV